MLFDSTPQEGSPWQPFGPLCKCCKRPIAHDEPVETICFDADPDHKLEEMNGTYHAACAKPYLKLVGVLDMLGQTLLRP